MPRLRRLFVDRRPRFRCAPRAGTRQSAQGLRSAAQSTVSSLKLLLDEQPGSAQDLHRTAVADCAGRRFLPRPRDPAADLFARPPYARLALAGARPDGRVARRARTRQPGAYRGTSEVAAPGCRGAHPRARGSRPSLDLHPHRRPRPWSAGRRKASTLLVSGALVWLGNVLVFGLLYWHFDSGGPLARYRGDRPYRDFVFTQHMSPELAPDGWRPQYVDYLILGLTTSTAFEPDRRHADVGLGEADDGTSIHHLARRRRPRHRPRRQRVLVGGAAAAAASR